MDHNHIVEQRERMDEAYLAWSRANPEYEDVAWQIYQAEKLKLNAMIKREKVKA